MPGVTGHFGQDPFQLEKTRTVRRKAWTFRQKKLDVSATLHLVVSTESDIISRGNHRINHACPFRGHGNITEQL